jgi:hypothetical protein
MAARDFRARDYNTDIFNTKNGASNGGYGLYDPHPYLKEQQNSDTRTRTSFQDSNIFGYKEGQNVTWQGTGRDNKPAGIRSGTYVNAHKSTDNVIYDPAIGMATSHTAAKDGYQQPTPELYQQHDYTVPKSRLGEEIFGMKQFNRQAVKNELLSGDDYWLKHTDPTKNIEENLTPAERRQRDLVSQMGSMQLGDYKQQPREETKMHATLDHWINPHTGEKRSNVPTEFNPFEKKLANLSSDQSPLTTTSYNDFTQKSKKQDTFEDVEKRVKDAFFSDLYGQSGKYGAKPQVTIRSEVNSTTGIFSKEGASKGNRWTEDMSAAQRRQDFMRTTGFPSHYETVEAQKQIPDNSQINLARSQLRMPKVIKSSELQSNALHRDEFNQRYNVIKDHRETNVFTLAFSTLPKTMDAESLKAMSGAKHVVNAVVQCDNIKNECTGFGEITIRLFEEETKEEIVNRFLAAGLACQDKTEAHGKKSNYSMLASTGWRDSKLEVEQQKVGVPQWENDKLSKFQNLTSNFDMGTNHTLSDLNRQYVDVIRHNQDGLRQAQNNAETHNHLMTQWESMRPQTAQPAAAGAFGGDMAFMKPTESFNTRSRQVQEGIRKRYY